MLQVVNIISTYKLLRVVSTSPCLKHFVFVLTTPSIDFDCLSYSKLILHHTFRIMNRYTRNELIVEQMLAQITKLKKFLSHWIVILKPGFIIGNLVSGVINIDNFI